MVNRGYAALGRNLSLLLIPIIMDLVSFFLGLMTTGFWGQSKITFKLTLDVGVPSISSILDQNVMASGINFNLGGGEMGIALLLFLVFFLVGAFVEAGFIGLLYELAAKEQSPSMELFLSYANRFWTRFLVLRIIIMAITLLGMLLVMPFMIFGIIAFMVVFIILRIKYIYLELTMVSEDLSLPEALGRSREHYENRSPDLANVLLTMLAVNFLAGLVLNFFWHPLLLLLGIFIYSYFATGLQLALFYTKPGLTDDPLVQP